MEGLVVRQTLRSQTLEGFTGALRQFAPVVVADLDRIYERDGLRYGSEIKNTLDCIPGTSAGYPLNTSCLGAPSLAGASGGGSSVG